MTFSTLQAVNQILGAVGQAPVSTLNESNPDVAIAQTVLTEINREVQGESWSFNQEEEYPLEPDNDGFIPIPATALKVDLSSLWQNSGIETTVREGRLYNKTNHTFIWTEPVKADITWLLDLGDVPSPVRDFIINRAATTASLRMVGDPQLHQLLQQRESISRASALEYECGEGDYTMFGSNKDLQFYSSYMPFKVLQR